MRPLAYSLLAVLGILAYLPAQNSGAQDPAALAVRDAELSQKAVVGLHELADALQSQKQHLRALEMRRTIWMDYDPEDKRAREKTGFLQVGAAWRVDGDALVLDRNLKGKRGKISKIDRDLEKLTKILLKEHRELAEAWGEAGDKLRAGKHWQQVLRLVPGDEQAAQLLAIREFEGFSGTDHELRMLRRGRAIHLASDWLNRFEFPVTDLKDQRLPLLEAAGLAHSGVQTEFFRVWGSIPVTDLEVIARDCERSLLLAHTMFGVSTGEIFKPRRLRNYVFVKDQGEYAAMLDVCKNQFPEDRFVFLRDSVDMCFLTHGGESLRVHKSNLGLPVCRDHAVRGVMQDAVGVKADGLWEGLGHAACGFLFGQTLCFMEEQLKEITSASHTKRRLAPDLETWMKIATESAWSKSDTRTSEIVLIKAARFTNEQRVKSWAICHYFAHWRPQYIVELDACKTEFIRTPPDIEKEFLRRTGYELPKIDSEWRSFWARGAQLRTAMTRDPLPNKKAKNRKAVERSRGLVDAINQVRAESRVGPLGWYLDASPDFVSVRRYEKALAAAEKELKKRIKSAKGKKYEPVEFPALPASVGKTVLWSRTKQAADVVQEWLRNPVYRNSLLAPGRDLVSVPSDTGGFLVGIAYPMQPTKRGEPLIWPRHEQSSVVGQIKVADLDPRARAAVLKAGIAADAVVGMPLSMHFARKIDKGVLGRIGCRLFERNRPIESVIVRYNELGPAGGPIIEGMIVCVPKEPLKSGKLIEARWAVPPEVLGEDVQVAPSAFTVK
ncbi:MAG: ribosome-binding protein aMBF1 (putative translation factor) [Planctomycetota bacterium]|jgi:ribosome-binding protein aMBF1 (putative translation factor)